MEGVEGGSDGQWTSRLLGEGVKGVQPLTNCLGWGVRPKH